jgi:glycosyltransferase involved in cell wall biosynthesis
MTTLSPLGRWIWCRSGRGRAAGKACSVTGRRRARAGRPHHAVERAGGGDSGAGRGTARPGIALLLLVVADLGRGSGVRLLGERAELAEVLGACDVTRARSCDEPFGRGVVEAMRMGVPVIATSVGGPAEVIQGRDRRRAGGST